MLHSAVFSQVSSVETVTDDRPSKSKLPGTSDTGDVSLCPTHTLPSLRSSLLLEGASSHSCRPPSLHLLCPKWTSGRQALCRTFLLKAEHRLSKINVTLKRSSGAPQTCPLAPGCCVDHSSLSEEKASLSCVFHPFTLPSVQTGWQVLVQDLSRQPQENTVNRQGSLTNSCTDNQRLQGGTWPDSRPAEFLQRQGLTRGGPRSALLFHLL